MDAKTLKPEAGIFAHARWDNAASDLILVIAAGKTVAANQVPTANPKSIDHEPYTINHESYTINHKPFTENRKP